MSKFSALYLLIFCFACTNNKAEKAVASLPMPKYFFFPKANVYFDTVNKEYVFLGNDGKSWLKEKQIPAIMQSMMDKSIVIDSPSTPVWKDNINHRLVYSAVLYATPNDTVKKKDPVIVQKPVSIDSAKKERKGLRKFLDKIFGRKKKDKPEDNKNNQ